MEKSLQKSTFDRKITLRDFRKAFNLKQETIAQAINKSQTSISRMESDDKELNTEQIKRLMDILKLKP